MTFNMFNLFRSFFSTEAASRESHTARKVQFTPATAYLIEKEAIVDQTIQPNRSGRVRFRGSWWPARCEKAITISPGEIVYVVGIIGITLLVQSASFSNKIQPNEQIFKA